MLSNTEQILRTSEAVSLLGVSHATFFRLKKDPKFPPTIDLGSRARGYRRTDLENWLKTREGGQ